jgi:hypothetical protein
MIIYVDIYVAVEFFLILETLYYWQNHSREIKTYEISYRFACLGLHVRSIFYRLLSLK